MAGFGLHLPLLFLYLQGIWLQSVHARYAMTLDGIIWDDSCTQQKNPENNAETKQQAIVRAWSGALEIIDFAWTQFQKTNEVLNGKELSEEQQHTINANDTSYALFFAFDSSPGGRATIEATLSGLYHGANANMGSDARPGESQGRIRISCHDQLDSDGRDECKKAPVFTDSSQSWDMSYINFCPGFWQKPRFDLLKTAAPHIVLSWFRHPTFRGTDAKTVMHEISHIWWIAHTNSRTDEIYGIANCASLAWACGPAPDNTELVENADTYAIYGEYGYFVANGYPDLWDPSIDYPVQIPVQSW